MRRDVGPPRQQVGDPNDLLLIGHDEQAAELLIRELGKAWPQLRVSRASGLRGGRGRFRMPTSTGVLLDLDTPDARTAGRRPARAPLVSGTLPVVVLTTDGDDEAGSDALTAGAQDYLSKAGTMALPSRAPSPLGSAQPRRALRARDRDVALPQRGDRTCAARPHAEDA